MKYNRDKFNNQSGVSVVEMLIVVLIIGIVSTIALMNSGTPKIQLQRQNVARELKVAFERARFDSVKRRAQSGNYANVVVAANAFTLKTDINQNGTLESSEDRANTAWNPGISIRKQDGTALTSNVTVAFNLRGEIITTGGSAIFLVCSGDCSTPTVNNSNLVLVTATGTVNILSGGMNAPTFPTPGVSNVNSNTNIQPLARVN